MMSLTSENPHIPYNLSTRPYHRRVAELAAELTPKGGSVLDYGCGLGHTLGLLRERREDLDLLGIDQDPECLRLSQERVADLHTYTAQSLEELSPSEFQVDTVLLSHVLEHLPKPLDSLLHLMTLLKPGGVALVAVPNPARIPVSILHLRRKHYVNRGHVCCWDRSHWMNFLENIAGLQVEGYPTDFIPLPLLMRFPHLQRIFDPMLRKLLPWFSYSNMAVIRKRPDS